MSALDELIQYAQEHESDETYLSGDEAAAELEELREAAQSLINELPDCTIDWARDGIGNTNANCIIYRRDELAAILEKHGKTEAPEA